MSVIATHAITLGANVKRDSAPSLSGGESLSLTLQGGMTDANGAGSAVITINTHLSGTNNYILLDTFTNGYTAYGTAASNDISIVQGGGEAGFSLDGQKIPGASGVKNRGLLIANKSPFNPYGYNQAVIHLAATAGGNYTSMTLAPQDAIFIKQYSDGLNLLPGGSHSLDSLTNVRFVSVTRIGVSSAPYFNNAGAKVYIASLNYHPQF